jgi:hypothetical protein
VKDMDKRLFQKFVGNDQQYSIETFERSMATASGVRIYNFG